MRLSAEQLARFDADGFLRFENMFDPAEVSALKAELGRVGSVDSDAQHQDRDRRHRVAVASGLRLLAARWYSDAQHGDVSGHA